MKVGDYRLARQADGSKGRKLDLPSLSAVKRGGCASAVYGRAAPLRGPSWAIEAHWAQRLGLTRRKRRPFLRCRGVRVATLKAKGFHTMTLHAQTIPNQPAIQPLPEQPEQPAQPQQPALPPEIPVPTDPPLGTPPLEVPPEQAPQHT